MPHSAIFGFLPGDLESVKDAVEICLGIHFVPHESSFRGEYYLHGHSYEKESLLLEKNMDPEDGEPFYSEFSEFPVLLLVGRTDRLYELVKLLQDKIEGCRLLRQRPRT